MTKEMEQLKKGQFSLIYDGDYEYFVVEDRTKRGLSVIEKSVDDNVGVIVEKGRIYDANGRGHVMMIRWYFPKEHYTFEYVCEFADKLDKRYRAIMEETCPDW
jgi:hypothetical protein